MAYLKDTCEIARQILAGDHDGDLEFIIQAAQARKKGMFRKGMRFVLEGTKNPTLEGQVCTVLKVNPTRVSVGVGALVRNTDLGPDFAYDEWTGGEYNVPPRMLKPLQGRDIAA